MLAINTLLPNVTDENEKVTGHIDYPEGRRVTLRGTAKEVLNEVSVQPNPKDPWRQCRPEYATCDVVVWSDDHPAWRPVFSSNGIDRKPK